jgi:glycosyltransferase involved in cell wall biosynthesis
MILHVPVPAPSPASTANSAPSKPPRIALAHDWLCGYRGGEAVLEQLCTLIDHVARPGPLLTMFDDRRPLAPAIDRWRARGLIHSASISRIHAANRARRWLLPTFPALIEELSARLQRIHEHEPIDLLISISSCAVKGLRAPPGVPHLCYCLSPARYVWAKPDEYQHPSLTHWLRSAGLHALASTFRDWDRESASNVDRFVAISTVVRDRIRQSFGRESNIVFPPVRLHAFAPHSVSDLEPKTQPHPDHWLVVSALEPYKRVDLAIQAAALADRPLRIAGTGSQAAALRSLAAAARTPAGKPADIEFLGRVSDQSLPQLYRDARLLIFPQEEDFGIVAVEALASGLPVIARRAGGALDIITEGLTGAFFDQTTPQAIVAAASRVPPLNKRTVAACLDASHRFSEARFQQGMLQQIERTLNPGHST